MKKKLKITKKETKEAMGASSAGAFSAPIGTPIKREVDEVTDTSSSGAYEGPAFLAKNKANWKPSKKLQFPGGKFVSIKPKCKKFPYCSEGAIDNPINIFDNKMIDEAVKSVSKKTGKSIEEITELVMDRVDVIKRKFYTVKK